MPLDMSLALAYSPKENNLFYNQCLLCFVLFSSQICRKADSPGAAKQWALITPLQGFLWRGWATGIGETAPYTLAKTDPIDKPFSVGVYLLPGMAVQGLGQLSGREVKSTSAFTV